GQRRGVPAGAAALRARDRNDDRADRHGRRRRRLRAGRRVGRGQAAQRQLRAGPVAVRGRVAGRVGTAVERETAVAPAVAGAWRGAHLKETHMKQPRLVVVGNGMAGIRTLEELLKLVPGMYETTVFGAEPHPNYNRILLSPVLAGEQDF